MLIDDLKSKIEEIGNFQTSGKCVDCGADVAINIGKLDEDGRIVIVGGALYNPIESYGYPDKYVYKCDDCHTSDPKLYQKTEVYTRVVGYLRPMAQMNTGKLSEIDQREMFDLATI
jgi:hypothetical protein